MPRLTAAWPTPSWTPSATDAEVADYADLYLEYDDVQRVTTRTAQGEGCSSCSGGLGTSTFSYTTSAFADGYNSWKRKTVETLADGNENITFTNFADQTMLQVFHDTTTDDEWAPST
jgi:hypothetical protein